MTAQITDIIIYQEESYNLTGYTHEIPFLIETFGINPKGSSSACWRGFKRTFLISENKLCIKDLDLNEEIKPNNESSIFGIKPITGKKNTKSLVFNKKYVNINKIIEYTGVILIGKDFISDLYVHMGFHPAWKYKTVIEISFERGKITLIEDISEKIKNLRSDFNMSEKKLKNSSKDSDIEKFINHAFNQKYYK